MKNTLFIKSIALITATVLFTVSFVGCMKKDVDPISTVVTKPTITAKLNGGEYMAVALGFQFTDLGAEITHPTEGKKTFYADNINQLNVDKPGVYELKYASNYRDGQNFFFGQFVPGPAITRKVIVSYGVLNPLKLAGTFKRTTNGSIMTVEKLADGVFLVTNFAGIVSTNPPPSAEYAAFQTVLQEKKPGEFEATVIGPAAAVYHLTITDISITNTQIKWIVPEFSPNVRIFNKQ